MTELKSEEVKNAIAARLLQIAQGTAVYKEAVTAPRYPHFFVHQINVNDSEERKRRHILTYSFDVRYRVTSDSSTDLKLEQNLDAMGLKLLSEFNIIDCNDIKIRIDDKSYEKPDGVLHFFFKVDVHAVDSEKEQYDKQRSLNYTIKAGNNELQAQTDDN